MDEKLLKALSVITAEERRILEEQQGIDPHIYMSKGDMVVDCDRLLKKGELISVRPHTRFAHFPAHTHNYIEVIYMCRGTTTHKINKEKIVLKAGELLFLNQNAVQEIFPAGPADIAVNFIILPEFFLEPFTLLGEEENMLRRFLVDALCARQSDVSYLHFHVADALPVQNLVENMVWTLLYERGNKRSTYQMTMSLLLTSLLGHMDRLDLDVGGYDSGLLGQVYKYVEENYKNGTLRELSGLVGRDMHWLSREIRKKTGKTYKELVKGKRMAKAAYLLEHTTLPVGQIIEMVGYDNTSYFFRIFKQQYSCSPKEYRTDKKGRYFL